MALLEVRDLCTGFHTDGGFVRVIDGLNLSLERGRTLGVVGESGCGKSVTALSIMRLLPQPSGTIESGSITFDGTDLLALDTQQMRRVRGNRIAMIFQEPMTALNPVQRIGKQLAEVIDLHDEGSSKASQRARALSLLEQVHIPAPASRLDEYPHQLSGGMRQRVMIAMALAMSPDLLIADEPTTALDVTMQAQLLDLLRELQRDTGMALLFITHDMGVVAEMCDEVLVMYAGRVAERALVHDLFEQPLHPYTQGLLRSIPRLEGSPKTTLHIIPGTVPAVADLPPGCRFANRCTYADEACRSAPALAGASARERDDDDSTGTPVPQVAHEVACHHWQRNGDATGTSS